MKYDVLIAWIVGAAIMVGFWCGVGRVVGVWWVRRGVASPVRVECFGVRGGGSAPVGEI